MAVTLSWECYADDDINVFHMETFEWRGQVIPPGTLDRCQNCERVIVWSNNHTSNLWDWYHFDGKPIFEEWA